MAYIWLVPEDILSTQLYRYGWNLGLVIQPAQFRVILQQESKRNIASKSEKDDRQTTKPASNHITWQKHSKILKSQTHSQNPKIPVLILNTLVLKQNDNIHIAKLLLHSFVHSSAPDLFPNSNAARDPKPPILTAIPPIRITSLFVLQRLTVGASLWTL